MKTPVFIVIIGMLLAGYSAKAQNPVVFKYKNNPSVSVNNYKQPNQVELAKKYNLDQRIVLNYIPVSPEVDAAKRNYKARVLPAPKSQVSGGVVPAAPKKKQVNSVQSPANYKRQFK